MECLICYLFAKDGVTVRKTTLSCRQSDLFEEIGDSECCWTESGKVTHFIPDAHPLKAFLLPLIPRSMALSF